MPSEKPHKGVINMEEEFTIALFKKAQKYLKNKKLEIARREFENVMELTEESQPWLYFESCFGLVEIYIEEGNYKSAMNSAFKALLHAPTQEIYLLGLERVRSVLAIIKKNGKLADLADSFGEIAREKSKNEDLYNFSKAIRALAKNNQEEARIIAHDLKTTELKTILYSLIE